MGDLYSNIYSVTNADSMLNNPGQLFFKFEEGEYKTNPRHTLNKKEMKKITDNIVITFEQILKSLKLTCHDQQKEYFKKMLKKLERYVTSNSSSFSFPGLQVINFTKAMLKPFSLHHERILICEKSDGVRFFLISFKNGKNLFFNRKEEFFLIETVVSLPHSNMNKIGKDDWEIENMLDGELIIDKLSKDEDLETIKQDTNLLLIKKQGEENKKEMIFKMKYLVFDAITIKTENIGHLPFRERLERLALFGKEIEFNKFSNVYVRDKFNKRFASVSDKFNLSLINKAPSTQVNKSKSPSIEVFIKDYFSFDNIESLYNKSKSPNFPHLNDGIILNYDDYPYYPGATEEIFKWKPAHLNTIDFELQGKNNLFVMYISEGREKITPVNYLFLKNEEEKEQFEKEYTKFKYSTGPIIIECFYDKMHICTETTNFNILCQEYNGFISRNGNDVSINLEMYDKDYINTFTKNKANYEQGGWRFLRFRNDKTHGNHINTFKNILQTIKEDLDIESIAREIVSSKELKLRTPKDILHNYMNRSIYLTGNSSFFKETCFTDNKQVMSPCLSDKNVDDILQHFNGIKMESKKQTTTDVKDNKDNNLLSKKRLSETKPVESEIIKETKNKFPILKKEEEAIVKEDDPFEYPSIEDLSDYDS